MTRPLKIDFVSDVTCPWCIIGLQGLEEALRRIGDEVDAKISFQPFELNPDMPPEGRNLVEHMAERYGTSAEQSAANRAMVCDRAAEVGFAMSMPDDGRIYNTFDAHRLLQWAAAEGKQAALKHALFEANFTERRNMSDPDVLVAAAEKAGLDGAAAREVLTSGRYAREVRDTEELWRMRGINAVPAVIVENRYLISGGQRPEAFEQALRQIAAEAPPHAS